MKGLRKPVLSLASLNVRNHLTDPRRRFLHVRREARERFGVPMTAFSTAGRLVDLDFDEAERLAAALRREAGSGPGKASTAGTLTAAVLLHELAHLLIASHPENVREVGSALRAPERIDSSAEGLERFISAFPPPALVDPGIAPAAYLTDGFDSAWEELLLLDLADKNPALGPLRELFEASSLLGTAPVKSVLGEIVTGFGRPLVDRESAGGRVATVQRPSLLDLLLAPQRQHPDSLVDQLRVAVRVWVPLLGVDIGALLGQVERTLGVIGEEERYLAHLATVAAGGHDRWGARAGAGFGAWGGIGDGPSAFSDDREWMSRTVLVAKNAFVWLAQLSRTHGRHIERLDQVPDETLDELVADGMDGLWLIGMWQRSQASKTIKRLRGQPDAEASAYAVDDYVIAHELGGDEALESLRQRASARGIRIACDMVPNHTGVDAKWVVEHPERFLQLSSPPYAAYRFSGPNVSGDSRIEVRIEDGYYDGTDAAVVFERLDPKTGERRYIFHGNDGTAMPWNDTAQIDFLNPAAREAVIDKIIEVCKQFKIVRFDAAMTLAKRHVKRLWHPAPGAEDSVPSRTRYGAGEGEFEALMPREFWREVVERAAAEAPDTLLLAEAFWMMEGYFVRELGMHRVYNSAFMHMLANEDNAEYISILEETLKTDPRVLERFVNYLSNPDEESVADTFGKGDKALAATVLLATLPGLPLFAHGQVDGLSEKYGMEFRAPRLDEHPDAWYRDQHRSKVAPLLHRRKVFASAIGFTLYRATRLGDPPGRIAEDVYAFSNSHTGEAALVIVNNSQHSARVRLDSGVRGAVPEVGAVGGLIHTRLVDELCSGAAGLNDPWLSGRDVLSGADYAWPLAALSSSGLEVELGAYQAVALLDVHVRAGAPWGTVDVMSGPAASQVARAGRQRERSLERRSGSAQPARAAAARRRRSRHRR